MEFCIGSRARVAAALHGPALQGLDRPRRSTPLRVSVAPFLWGHPRSSPLAHDRFVQFDAQGRALLGRRVGDRPEAPAPRVFFDDAGQFREGTPSGRSARLRRSPRFRPPTKSRSRPPEYGISWMCSIPTTLLAPTASAMRMPSPSAPSKRSRLVRGRAVGGVQPRDVLHAHPDVRAESACREHDGACGEVRHRRGAGRRRCQAPHARPRPARSRPASFR